MGREARGEVGGAEGRAVVGKHLELVEVGVAKKLGHHGVVKPPNDAVVLVRPLVFGKK